MRKAAILLGIFVLLVGTYYWGKSNGDPNEKMIFGDTGFPKNCRAIIYKNYEGYYLEEYTAEEALDSIYRNCGDNGYSWGQ